MREELNYPPYSRFANLICSDEDSASAREKAQGLAAALRKVLPEEVSLIGPASAPLARLKNRYRWHVALRGPVESDFASLIRPAPGGPVACDTNISRREHREKTKHEAA